jgi:hypothetical protein
MNDVNQRLMALARRNAAAYIACTRPNAVLLVGSVATGECDGFSDVDMGCYYDTLPSHDQLQAARRLIGERQPGTDVGLGEEYVVDGVTCQVGHLEVAFVQRDLAAVLDELDIDDRAQKRLGGLLEGVPLHGPDLIGRWQARAAAYPDALARAMVEHHLRQLEPVWAFQEYLARRDATLWTHRLLVEAAQHVLGVLAGLNRRYFSTFQFKRLRRFVGDLPVAPDHLADRIDGLFATERASAMNGIEDLARETVALVADHMPGVELPPLIQPPDGHGHSRRP